MPTYEYECSHCGYKFELSQGMKDKHIKNCPQCKKEVKRLIGSGAGIIFKGSGFYATDYRKNTKPGLQDKKDNVCPAAKQGCNGCAHKEIH
ncbi:MAG: hypothetical protein KKH29_04435 [Candidatus Omnitrophica bacterium]|nr:hypothetical protein [Candidatus Omnitrophota bacterium]MBU4346558.1 hypothetical protein [Candidatus Omnitrophota bacterium]MBU4472967.1 hypothetical protein [Candidatus Omnitrophota bacterium]MCG2707003.1 hypothetical protein [Candidatus Omnitrophota bacterium]